MVRGLTIWLFLMLVFPVHLFALSTISINATLDPGSLNQGWPIKGTLEITHDADQKVDESSVMLKDKPLKIRLLRNVQISPDSPLTVSIYQFTLPAQNQGSYLLPSLSVQVGGKVYQTFPQSYEVQGPVAPPPVISEGVTQENSLKLEAYVEGPKDLYPGQKTKLVYKYIYSGSIDLSKEVLPMLEAKGLLKVGRTETKNYTEGASSVLEISQEAQALKEGEFSWGPSVVEGVVYVEDALGNKQFTTTKLVSQAPTVTLQVKPFPQEGKPASFNGAFGQLSFQVNLTSPSQISVGDPIVLEAVISGNTTNWDLVMLPELCCQPGFAGFFKQSDLLPVGKMLKGSKSFTIHMTPLSDAIKSIPAIQFSFFNPETGKYQILYSSPLPLSVSPTQEISDNQETVDEAVKGETHETQKDWDQIYQNLPLMDDREMFTLTVSDLKNYFFGTWRWLWLIPLSFLAIGFQLFLKDYFLKNPRKVKKKSSDEIYKEMLKAPPASAYFFQLLKKSLILRLYEKGEISSQEVPIKDLPQQGIGSDVKAFLSSVEGLRYSGKESDKAIYPKVLEEGKRLYKAI